MFPIFFLIVAIVYYAYTRQDNQEQDKKEDNQEPQVIDYEYINQFTSSGSNQAMYMSAEDKQAHMQSTYWYKLKQQKLASANHRCEKCDSTESLELHHLTYSDLGKESQSSVVVLCRSCHQYQHDHYGDDRSTLYYPLVDLSDKY